MKRTNIHEAKTNLSKLIDIASHGQEVIICKAGVPVVKLIAVDVKKSERKPGIWAGKVQIKDDFDQLPDSFMDYFT